MSRFSKILLITFPAVLLMVGCEHETASKSDGDTVLATVGDKKITQSELKEEAEWRLANNREVPPATDLLKEMVDRQSLLNRAEKSGIPDEAGTKRLVETLMIAKLREAELDTRLAEVEVSEEELKIAYEERAAEFTKKGLDRFSVLYQEIQPNMSAARLEESRARLREAISLIDASPAPGGRGPAASGFGQVAVDFSEDQASRYRGGDIGWMEEDLTGTRWPEELLQIGRGLKKNSRSGIVETPKGFYVIMKTDARPGGRLPLAGVSDELHKSLLREKRIAVEKQFVADSLEASHATIDEKAVEKITLPVSRTRSEPAGPPANPQSSATR